MRLNGLIGGLLLSLMLVSIADAQRPICIDGRCELPRLRLLKPLRPLPRPLLKLNQAPDAKKPSAPTELTIRIEPLLEEIFLSAEELEAVSKTRPEDRFDQIIRATVRVTVNNVCGSGTIVGRDSQGNAIVLTNAHVAGTSRGRVVNVQRWETDGTSERGKGTIIAAGYGRGMSVDFALLRCDKGFAQDVTPIPLADRYPDAAATVTTFGCPRCEWPSLQVLKLNRSEGQVLSWKPEAIGGRSGSSVIDHTSSGPRVVALLTWASNGEGMGQSTPFLLNAMRGRLPANLEGLPPGTREVGTQQETLTSVYQVPASTSGQPLSMPLKSNPAQSNNDLIDSITEPKRRDPSPDKEPRPDPDIAEPSPGDSSMNRKEVAELLVGGAATGAMILLLIQYGIPIAMRQLRKIRQDRGNEPLLSQDQFDELIERLQDLARGLAVMEAKYERKDGPEK